VTGGEMKRKISDWTVGIIVAVVTVFLILMLALVSGKREQGDSIKVPSKGEYVAVIELNGTIYSSSKMVKLFKRYGESRAVKAIVFRINSPGGAIAPSQEIYNAVKRARDSGTPIVVSMSSVAASGGYYAACGADTIMANPGTTTGSIGVIAEIPNVSGLLKKIGVSFTTVKSGKFKDTGTPYRNITPAERAYLQSWIDDAFDQFVTVVSKERNIPKKKLLKIADGRVFTGRQAKKLGLIDLLGDFEDAVNLAAKMGHISGKPQILRERKRSITLMDLMFQQAEGVIRGLNGMIFLYRFN